LTFLKNQIGSDSDPDGFVGSDRILPPQCITYGHQKSRSHVHNDARLELVKEKTIIHGRGDHLTTAILTNFVGEFLKVQKKSLNML
jgi:hypothetical protein